MKRKRLILWLVLGASLALGAAGGYRWWRSSVLQRTGSGALHEATAALKEDRAVEALSLLDQARPSAEESGNWKELEVTAAAAAGKVERLLAIYSRGPQRILENEEASLLVFRAQTVKGEEEAAALLSSEWKGKTTRPEQWTLTTADALMGAGRGREARKLLEAATSWKPADEVQRMMRLALLQAPEDLEAAWHRLQQAYKLDPKNADVRSFRAQMLESAGRKDEARVEYVAALVAQPDNPLRRDQLAEFYLRQGDFDHAVQTWLDAGKDQRTGFMDLKGQFWSRVVAPSLSRKLPKPASEATGPWRVALDALELAPPGHWVAPVAGGVAPALKEHGEIWWLALLDQIQAGDEEAVASSLAAQPAKAAAMAPDLSAALKTVLALRAGRSPESILWPSLPAGGTRPAFFAKLQQLTVASRTGTGIPATDETAVVARHPGGLAYAFAAAGWRETALRLYAWDSSKNVPDNMLYTIGMCLRLNRGPAPAAALLEGRKGALLNGLAAECLLAAGNVEGGLKRLQEASVEDSDAGRRAGWLLATAQLEKRDFSGARSTLKDTPGLSATSQGKDLAAKLALAEGNAAEATNLYREAAAAGSAEGRTWMLRQAVLAGDPAAARDESRKLRELLPDQLQTRDNERHLPDQPGK